jgi:hypothetical protein
MGPHERNRAVMQLSTHLHPIEIPALFGLDLRAYKYYLYSTASGPL